MMTRAVARHSGDAISRRSARCLALGSHRARSRRRERARWAQMGHAAPPACADPLPKCAVTRDALLRRRRAALADLCRRRQGLWRDLARQWQELRAAFRHRGAGRGRSTTMARRGPKIVALGRWDAGGELHHAAREELSRARSIVTRSTDGGKSFSPPQPLVDDKGQRFETFIVGAEGRASIAAWLDKRDAARGQGRRRELRGQRHRRRLVGRRRRELFRQEHSARSFLRMLPHRRRARSRRPARLHLAACVRE